MTNPIWKDVSFYLAGPMEYVDDHGIGWREEIEEKLKEMGAQRKNILSPTNKPFVAHALPVSKEWELQKKYRDRKDWLSLHKQMKKIITMDLRMVDKCDILIARLPKDVRTVGTIEEIVTARRQKKPVLIICPEGIEHVSAWIIGLIKPSRIFSNHADALAYISSIAEDGPRSETDAKEFVLFDFDRKDDDEEKEI